MKKYSRLVEYLLRISSFEHNIGNRINFYVHANTCTDISYISNLLGQIHVYEVIGDTENVKSLTDIFYFQCFECGISLDEYDEWLNNQEA